MSEQSETDPPRQRDSDGSGTERTGAGVTGPRGQIWNNDLPGPTPPLLCCGRSSSPSSVHHQLSPRWWGEAVWRALEVLIQAQILIGSVCWSDFLSGWGMLKPRSSLVSATFAAGNDAVVSLAGSVHHNINFTIRNAKKVSIFPGSAAAVTQEILSIWPPTFLNLCYCVNSTPS